MEHQPAQRPRAALRLLPRRRLEPRSIPVPPKYLEVPYPGGYHLPRGQGDAVGRDTPLPAAGHRITPPRRETWGIHQLDKWGLLTPVLPASLFS